MQMFADPSRTFELLNASSLAVTFWMLFFIAAVLRFELREHERIHPYDFFSSMSPVIMFMIASIIFIFGVFCRAGVVWLWRRFYVAELYGPMQQWGLVVATIFITVGGLCVIYRATVRIYGNWPWLLALTTSVIFTLVNMLAPH